MLRNSHLWRWSLRAKQASHISRSIVVRPRRSQFGTVTHPFARRYQQHFIRSIAAATLLYATTVTCQWCLNRFIIQDAYAEERLHDEDRIKFEPTRRQPSSSDDNRNIISSQHLQVVKSWENPGVYAWGSNSGKAVAPDSDDKFVKIPRRIPFFDGKLLRDIKIDRNMGAAIDEKGDLLQWGSDFASNVTEPVKTFIGYNLVSLALSRDRIIGLSTNGTVYSIPMSQIEQRDGPKPATSSWLPFWSGSDNVSYRARTPNLGWNERVIDISSGLEHALILTSSGRVFSFASGSQDFPSRGQLGIPGLRWETRPTGAFDVPHEITTLRGFSIKKIATGDYHSIVHDSEGRVFTFGDNTSGQLGFPLTGEVQYVDAPSLLSTQILYPGQTSKVTNIFAGGNISFLAIEITKPNTGLVTADTWAFGFGLTGQLGTGRWIHTQSDPVKVPAFSGLFEWDEKKNVTIPIRLSTISIGATHSAAVLDNVASVAVSGRMSRLTDNDTNWGRDILFWGNNEFYQIGSGKRNNAAMPIYIQPLDQAAEQERAASVIGFGKQIREKEMHRFQITPRKKVKVKGRTIEFEQKVECGRSCTVVYSAV